MLGPTGARNEFAPVNERPRAAREIAPTNE
jgi:hypothetical protein